MLTFRNWRDADRLRTGLYNRSGPVQVCRERQEQASEASNRSPVARTMIEEHDTNTGSENEDELRAENWLREQGYKNIRRPCSDPPDFVIDGNCAVEVTRLNQRIKVGDDKRTKGEEEERIALTDQLKKILRNLGRPGNEGRSWVIDCEYDFSEPRPKSKIVTRQVNEALAPLLKPYDDSVISSMRTRHFDKSKHAGEISLLRYPHICLDCGICLELAEFSCVPERFFLQNVSDGKGVGIAEEMKKSIQNRISEKSTKIRNQGRIEEYENWWLLLVDHICHLPMESLSDHELSCIRDQDFDFWTRIVIVSNLTFKLQHWHYDLFSAETDHGSSSHPR